MSDLRFAARQLAKNWGFTAVAVITLALGIGANSAMFSVVDGTVLQPLPLPDAGRLVHVLETTPRGDDFTASAPNFIDFRAQNRTLTGLAAVRYADFGLTGMGDAVRVSGAAVSHDLFSVLGVTPSLGRGFVAADDEPRYGTLTTVISHALWQSRFAGDPRVLGAELTLDGRVYEVVGVMPERFRFLDVDLFVPLAPRMTPSDRGDHWLELIGRMRDGVTVQDVEADLDAIAARFAESDPGVAGWGTRVEPAIDWIVGPEFRRAAFVLLGAVAFLLLMACVNLANLLFARASLRMGEFGVRAALGAGRARLVRQLMIEAALLAVLGIVLALPLAYGAIEVLHATATTAVPRLESVAVDGRVLAFTIAVGFATTLLFGLIPALRASQVDVTRSLRSAGTAGIAREGRRLRDALVVIQIALATVLLVGAALLLRSYSELQRADPGFEPADVYSVMVGLGGERYREPWQKVVFFSQLADALEAQPGIEAVGATQIEPYSDWNFVNDVTPVERAAEVGDAGLLQAGWRAVTPGLFDALGIPLLQGRLFHESDPYDGPRIAVVTRSLADAMWPGEDAVGKRFFWGGVDGEPRTVIGVVGDFEDVQRGDTRPVLFLPHNQLPWPNMAVVVRAAAGAVDVPGTIRAEVAALDPALALPEVRTLESRMQASVASPRLRTLLLGAFAAIALGLAALGTYGVMAFNATRRTREIGLRIALGARPESVRRLLLARGLRLTVIGLAVGAVASLALARVLASLLYETAALDPAAWSVALVTLALTALGASWLPARRASRVPPMEALRHE